MSARNSTPQPSTDSPLAPLLAALKAELLPALRAEIRSEIAAEAVVRPTMPPKRLFSIRDLGRIYGVGRIQVRRDIAAGRIRPVERKCRGGQVGVFVPREEAEKAYAGVRP